MNIKEKGDKLTSVSRSISQCTAATLHTLFEGEELPRFAIITRQNQLLYITCELTIECAELEVLIAAQAVMHKYNGNIIPPLGTHDYVKELTRFIADLSNDALEKQYCETADMRSPN